MSLQNYEQYVLDAEKAFEQGLYLEGKAYLDNASAEEPTYGKAHNHLGSGMSHSHPIWQQSADQ